MYINENPIELELELDEDVIIEKDEIPEAAGDFSEEISSNEDNKGFLDDGDDSDDEEEVVVQKTAPVQRKGKLRKGEFLETVKRVPMVGQTYRAKFFSIKIIEKKGKVAVCKVIASQQGSSYKVGDTYKAEEIAFYSDYYDIFY